MIKHATPSKYDFGSWLFLWFCCNFFQFLSSIMYNLCGDEHENSYYFFFNCCFHYQFLPPFFIPLLLCLALSHNFCREMRTTNQPVKWWLPHPEEPAALPGNYMNDNLKILKATWKAVYIPGMACLFPIKSISASLYLEPTEVCHLYSKHKPKPHKCHLLSFRSKNADIIWDVQRGFVINLCERWDWNHLFIQS